MNTDRIIRVGGFVLGMVLAAIVMTSSAIAAEKTKGRQLTPGATVLYVFWGKGCPHCEEEKAFLRKLTESDPSLLVRDYEVWYNKANADVFGRVMRSIGRQQVSVPATVIGNKVFLGFTPAIAEAIGKAVADCRAVGCDDPLASVTGSLPAGSEQGPVRLPLLGDVDPGKISIPVFTLIIGLLDSFNPCAFFVLLFLLSMLIHARSRRKMLLIGGIFVFFSGFIYFLFMAAWLNVFLLIGRLTLITMAAGLIALLVGVLNIKDFFFFRQGVSLVIPEKAKPRLFERMRNLLRSSSLATMVAGTVLLAVTANAYELLCTAGFPMVYTRALTLHNLALSEYYLYLVLYNVVYVIPLAVIVAVMTVSLGSRKLTEWQGRQLKLVSGLMMLLLGLILLVRPELLNNAAASAGLLVLVVLMSYATIAISKRIKPGIAAE